MPDFLETDSAEPAHIQVRRYFHRRILRGDLQPGERIPPTQDLAKRWGLSCTAIQKALSSLSAAGMVERLPRRGTFVSQSTGAKVIGIVIGPDLADESSHYYRALLKALQNEITSQRKVRNWNVLAYDGLTPSSQIHGLAKSESYLHLMRDFHNYPFRGLVEIATGVPWIEDLHQRVRLPAVNSLDVQFDIRAFVKASLDLIQKSGFRRVAYLQTIGLQNDSHHNHLHHAAQKLGMPCPQMIEIAVSGDNHQRAQAVHHHTFQEIRRWKDLPVRERPEALVVSDDIAMRSVALAILEAGIKVPDELFVVSMANQGVNLYYGIPVIRYEFSPGEQARRLIALLWNRILEKAIPPLPILLPGQFDFSSNTNISAENLHPKK